MSRAPVTCRFTLCRGRLRVTRFNPQLLKTLLDFLREAVPSAWPEDEAALDR
ncbi:hypothetical protein [Paraburkholderia sp. UYCP14C]|uniref:hypothetical protein n=1 Tax=Paraburkholderia sp. UYCP14C TaxID=2511130 RepID=UPI00145A0131|nr:hypothetical protein [Paraburkholderia sp. UYCP14C]